MKEIIKCLIYIITIVVIYPTKISCLTVNLSKNLLNEDNQYSCGLIQVSIVYDNNCNGIFDAGDARASDIVVNLTSGQGTIGSTISQDGYGFFSNLESGSYSSNIELPNGWQTGSSNSNIVMNDLDIGLMNFYLCQSCNCLNTSGPPEQNLQIPNDVIPGVIPFMVTDPDYSPWQLGAYNSNEFLLVIFNRWGNEVFRKTRKDCNGLKNGEISWNGLDNNGNQLQQDNYVGYLVLQNCDYSCKNDEWSSNFFNGLLGTCPKNVKYFNVILVK